MAEFLVDIDKEFDFTFDERGNTFLALRKVSWNNGEHKLEMRKWYNTPKGEKASSGFSFLTEEGPNELVRLLTSKGYGNTGDIICSIKDRENFMYELVNQLNGEVPEGLQIDEKYYDPKESLFGEDDE